MFKKLRWRLVRMLVRNESLIMNMHFTGVTIGEEHLGQEAMVVTDGPCGFGDSVKGKTMIMGGLPWTRAA